MTLRETKEIRTNILEYLNTKIKTARSMKSMCGEQVADDVLAKRKTQDATDNLMRYKMYDHEIFHLNEVYNRLCELTYGLAVGDK